jgi:pyridoxamine 5'-phosphate oxidase
MEILRSENPIVFFQNWLNKAMETEPNDAEAMALATVLADGSPSVRMVLLKGIDQDGFRFFTNMESNKGRELAAQPKAALCFHWKSLLRQVRVWGDITPLPAEEADEYFATRHPQSKLGAWASQQSRPLESRETLINRVKEYEDKFSGGDVPRPPYWGGYLVKPQRIEFWQQGDARLHDRFLFTKIKDGWDLTRLNP